VTEQGDFSPNQAQKGAELRETHAGIVILIGDKAFKLKKPVHFGFLDFSTPDKRRKALEREVALNRRLAPEVYEGVFSLCDEQGRPIEPVLVMKRMPSDRSLEALARSGASIDLCVSAVAKKVAEFHVRCNDSSISEEIGRGGSPAELEKKWRDNFVELERLTPRLFDAALLDRIRELALSYIRGRKRLFLERIREGEIKDGHGDLLSSDIFCLDSTPQILDCIEFDDTYRHCDVASEIAFLAMDLIRLGRPEQARLFLEEYVRAYQSPVPYTLLEHYISYRACVRAKVAALSYEQGRVDMGEQAIDLLRIALDHALRARPLLVVVGGVPGTGKSTLSKAIQDADVFAAALEGRPRFELLRSDVVRKELGGVEPGARLASSLDSGIYTSEFTLRTYQEMAKRASDHLEMGQSVILDATFSDKRLREIARSIAKSTGAALVELRCDAPLAVCQARIEKRLGRGDDASEADLEVAQAIAGRFDEWPTAMSIDTSGSIEESLDAALKAIENSIGTGFVWR